ncbi:DUF302 domain-containing protein [Citrobacter freundii]|nr:DUF302 domain-containing protein [Citrobacter freundii]
MTVTSHAANTGNTMIKTYSTYNYQQTREHLIAAIESNNLVFFGEFDHAKEAKNAGLTMLPTTVIIFGNPKGGTSLMQAYPDMALDLPFREGANKQVISSQADSLIKISRIWADFFPANTSNQPI